MKPNLSAIAKKHDKFIEMANFLTNDNEQRSKDLVQDMYLKLHDRLTNEKLKPLKSITVGYCFRLLKYMVYNDHKKKRYEFHYEDFEDWQMSQKDDWQQDYFEEGTDDEKSIKTLQKRLKKVPYLEREVLLQHQEKTQRQIQEETGVCRDRLRMYKNRALDKLKAQYQNIA
ncbi:sigma-70 family RNA polymerase sigma factor [Flagellimonas onchidii]|uniref:sigma-70 family RNA polymerase sigma factor n=1 Tax=Flagellimonas onchidii TaxID=2562684 RepID=UPI0010A5F098|nr:sigma-70 family RNA polymerase sigma factor [Allomuricauda onchidii]